MKDLCNVSSKYKACSFRSFPTIILFWILVSACGIYYSLSQYRIHQKMNSLNSTLDPRINAHRDSSKILAQYLGCSF